MSEMLACRICLAIDDVKLYNLFKYRLETSYELITGTKITKEDGLPQFICTYCVALLNKSVTFKKKCCVTQNLLKLSFGPQRELTLENLRFLSVQSSLSYSYTDTLPIIEIEYVEPEVKVEKDDSDADIKLEELLAGRKVKKGKLKKKKQDVIEDQDLDVKLEDLPDLSDNDADTFDPIEQDDDLNNIEVIILSKEEQLSEIEARKSSSNYNNSFFKCEKCFKGFITDSTLRNHMLRHDPKRGDYECEICRSRWSDARSLKAHTVTAHERKYVCKLCKYVSRSSHRAKEHRKWHNGFKFDCKFCGATFAKSTSHLTHIRLHHPSRHCCEICGESFIGDNGLRMHKRKAHLDHDTNNSTSQCIHCEVKFRTVDALEKHLTYKNGVCDTTASPCVHCGLNLDSEELLTEHVKEHQNGDSFSCDACQRSFNNERSYSIHYQRVHLGVKLKQYKPSLKRPGDSVVCEICGKKCITKATLTYHQRIHTGERPYHCSQCPKKFSVYQRLQIHVRTHTGESPYKCKHCPKAFKHKAALNRHDRVHTGAKPYSCSHCGKSFSQSNSMKLHVNTVHLKLPAPYRARRNKN